MKLISTLSTATVILAIWYGFHNDDFALYTAYTFLVILLLRTIFQPRVSTFLKFVIGLFILGNWLKITIHGIFKHPYVEATGAFSDTPEEWEKFFLFSIVIAIALILSAIASMVVPRNVGRAGSYTHTLPSSKLFTQASILLVLLIYALNWQFGFYRIGVARSLNLPFGLNAPASFIVFMVAPMLTAIVATNSIIRHRIVTTRMLFAVAVVVMLAAVTMYSRATVVIVMLPIVLGMYKKSREINGVSQSLVGLAWVAVPTTIGVLAAVSVLRIIVYGGAETVSRTELDFYLYESLSLFVDRWVGAEGLMVAVSSEQSLDLFLNMLMENPANGTQSLYQNLAGSQYLGMNLLDMTFLTLPGTFAILAFSGSAVLVFLGILLIAGLGLMIEQVTSRLFPGHHSIQFLVSAGVAYHFSQMIFPQLLFPFVVQMLFFLFVLGLVYRGMFKPKLIYQRTALA